MSNQDKLEQLEESARSDARSRGASGSPVTLRPNEVLPLYTFLVSTLESSRLNPGDRIRLDNLRAALRAKINWELDTDRLLVKEPAKPADDIAMFKKYERKQNAKIAALREVREFLADPDDPDYFVPKRYADSAKASDGSHFDDDGLGKMYAFDPIMTDDDDEVPRDLKYPHKRPPSPFLKKFGKKPGNFKSR